MDKQLTSDNTQALKNLARSSTFSSGKQQSALGKIPGVDAIKKVIKSTNPKQVVDVVLFTAGIALMFKFGKSVAETIDNQMPTEKNMMEMMKGMQGGAGMPPAPM